jgi:hypothetical protein
VVRFPVNNTVFLAGTLRLEGGVKHFSDFRFACAIFFSHLTI